MGGHFSTERPLDEITGQYDRVARFYKVFEPLYLIFPIARRRGASAGMLREARKLVERHSWSNVSLLRQDAAQLQLDQDVDAVLFSLSYSAMPEPKAALALAWERLRPGARLAVMDAGLTETRLRSLLDPIARVLIRLGPGNPYSRPWDDLAEYGRVAIERFMFIYYVCTVIKDDS
ncbi:MAG TPA: class I SAM-dependent methyltransferase [Solirubrobacterales bacterium]|nr:class I SAM-dependent methyltransferase [Solirubrobacterales bacterium]